MHRPIVGMLVLAVAVSTATALAGAAPRAIPPGSGTASASTIAYEPAGGTLHANHVSADPQVSADGTITVETAFVQQSAHLVVHADDGGQPGRVLGHTPISAGVHEDVTVDLGDSLADRSGPITVWIAVHTDDGDGSFDPHQDPILESVSGIVGTRIPVRSGSDPALVTAREVQPQPTTGTVVIRQVALPEPGHVVVRVDDEGSPGRAVGTATLSAGTHSRVRIDVDREFLAERDRPFRLWAIASADDGNGEFDDADRALEVGDRIVGTRFAVRSLVVSAGNGTVETTETTALVVTPTTETTASDPNRTGTTAIARSTSVTTSTTTVETVGDTPLGGGSNRPLDGFGIGVGALAVILGLIAFGSRER